MLFDSSRTTIAAVLSHASRHHTPCGTGSLVWHSWGAPTAAPLVLLHGGSGSWTHWLRNVQALAAAGHWVLVPDLPGFGESALPPQGADADALPAPLELGLQQLVGDRPVNLVGFSFGGLTAGLLAVQYPHRPSRLVIVGAPGLGLASRPFQGMMAWRHLPDAANRRRVHRFNLTALMLRYPESVDEVAVEIQETNVPRDRMPGRRLAFGTALADAMVHIGCPVHAIYGQQDALYLGRQTELEAAVRAASPTLHSFQFIPDAGHWVQYERPDVFNSTLIALLS